ncbi:accessory gene regulator ArgB-like protein [Paenibacillus sp. J2TS4]|uniref:accessory gene regulator ArgB-like protein n=1 Tax=Paenibacillus sp. J2TS4 TaxID=2807194 RepID=UPI001B2914E1|nr:accessory gene regulator B family protein [Paenibacillus sp. J2TS4]GIP32987.1 hypothetical protein J2TS4_21970 [Paenibacillus sp. J2TS4]
MNTLAYRIAAAIKKADSDRTHSIEVMQYSLAILLNTALIIVVSLLIGWWTGQFTSTLVALISLSGLRMASGGVHFKSPWACNVVSVLLIVGVGHIPVYPESLLFWVNVINLVLMISFAPRPDANAAIPVKLYPLLKWISIGLVSSNFIIGSHVIGLAFLVQSLTVVPWRKEGIK